MQYFVAIFQGLDRLRYGSFLLFLQKIIYVGIGFFSLQYIKTAEVLSLSYTIGMLFATFFGFLWIKKLDIVKFYPFRGDFFHTLKRLFPFLLVRISSEVYGRIDTLMIGFFLGSYWVGIYALPYKITEGVTLFVISFVFSIFPHLSYKAEKEPFLFKKTFAKAFFLISIWGVLILLGGIIFAHRYFISVFGKEYKESLSPFLILLFAVFFRQINFLLTHALISLKKERFYSIIISITAFINFVSNLWFIPHFGVIGGAYTTLISEILLMIFAVRGIYKWIKEKNG